MVVIRAQRGEWDFYKGLMNLESLSLASTRDYEGTQLCERIMLLFTAASAALAKSVRVKSRGKSWTTSNFSSQVNTAHQGLSTVRLAVFARLLTYSAQTLFTASYIPLSLFCEPMPSNSFTCASISLSRLHVI